MDTSNYKTRDLNEAAALLSHGFQFIGLEASENPNQFVFIFNHNEGILDVVRDYYDHKDRIEPIDYGQNQKRLKNELYFQGKRR